MAELEEVVNSLQCGECKKVFKSKGILKDHINNIHKKIKNFSCEKCEYKTNRSYDLKKHVKQVHDKIKDFICEQCEFTCSTKVGLSTHVKNIHLNIRNYKCEKCEYAAKSTDHLNKHVKQVHDKIKDIKCDQCEYICATKVALTAHIKRKHLKIKNFKCPKESCGYSCVSNGDLKKHIESCSVGLKYSRGEKIIRDILDDEECKYIFNGSFGGVKSKNGGLVRFDFVIFIDDKPRIIEYDGRQHFVPVCFGGISKERAEENLATLKINDNIKNKFCEENNYPMLRIPYTERNNLEEIVLKFISEKF